MTPTDLETLLSSNVDTSKTNLETLLSALIGSNVGVMKTLAIIDSSLRTLKDDMATTKEYFNNVDFSLYPKLIRFISLILT